MEAFKVDTAYTERIVCPECGFIQIAEVGHVFPFPWLIYVHECELCGYTIMESEWQVSDEDEK